VSDLPAPDELALAVVIGDFGRDAAIRFCATLAAAEREVLQRRQGGGDFFDEQRRITLSLSGDLPYVKAPHLARYRAGAPLDERVLVGFEGGLTPADVTDRIGVLVLEALAGPVRRGLLRALVLLPCNTLAPVSWGLQERFASAEAISEMAGRARRPLSPEELGLAKLIVEEVELFFPTVPGSVIAKTATSGGQLLAPLGTVGIVETYRQEATRLSSRVNIVTLDDQDQRVVLNAIQGCITGGAAREQTGGLLEALINRLRAEHGAELVVVEACTDLDHGLGLDSNAAYAEAVVRMVYRAGPAVRADP
jgi:hypothetical protein